MARLEILLTELAAIDMQNRMYWQAKKPEQREKLEHQLREDRRHVVIAELLELMQGATANRD
jgi:hypothetical protein